MNESGEIVGMVDVLKLTYATLEQVMLLIGLMTKISWLIRLRSTLCQPGMMKALHGTNSGFLWTMNPTRWYLAANSPIHHTAPS